MGTMADDYTKSLHEEHKMYAAWPPNSNFELGDFGIMTGDEKTIFNRYGNIAATKQFPKIQFETRRGSSPKSTLVYISKDAVKYNFGPGIDLGVKGLADIVKCKLDVNFSESNGIFFYSDNITVESIDDKGFIFEKIKSHYKNKLWRKEFVLVTDVIKAGNTTVCISEGRDASASFEAKVPAITIPVPPGIPISLGNAGIKLESVSKTNIGYDLTSEPGLTPFMTLYGIREWSPWRPSVPDGDVIQLSAMDLRNQLTYGPEILNSGNTIISFDNIDGPEFKIVYELPKQGAGA